MTKADNTSLFSRECPMTLTETVKRLQRIVRDPRAGYAVDSYEQSLRDLKHAKLTKEGLITKTSIILGLGETNDKLKEAMADLRAIVVDILTFGQYLQPTPLHLTVKEYVTLEKFGELIGFRYVASGPLVSSLIATFLLDCLRDLV